MNPVRYPWFPYVFALGLPLTVYSYNQAAFAGSEVLRPALVFVLIAAFLVAIFRRAVRNQALADTLAAVPLICIWLLGLGWQLILSLALLVLVSVLLRNQRLSENSVPVFNALSVGVLILPVFVIFQVEQITHDDSLQQIPYSPFSAPRTTVIQDEKPDIYHIVLDAYGGTDALAGEFGFDNSGFFDELRSLDFVVNESITVPYNETIHTMSAIFLGEYLREGEFPIDAEFPSTLRSTLGTLIVNGPIHDILRTNDYSILYTDTGHEFLRFPDDAEVLQSKDKSLLNRFEMHLGAVSGLNLLLPELYEVTQEHPLILAVKNAFKNDYSEFESPKFVYQHVLAPHTPFIIDRTGLKTSEFSEFSSTAEGDSVVRDDPALRRSYVLGYLEKLRFVNDRALEQLRRLQELPGKKIIVIHGDHGPGSKYFGDDAERTCLRERFTSFLAVYSNDPGVREDFRWVSDPSATPVNLYRSMLNTLLYLDLEILPNQSSFVRYSTPHQLHPIDSAQIPLACNQVH